MTITALPEPPLRSDPANFATRADEFLGALPAFATEANALATDVNAKQVTASAAATTATTKAGEASASAAAALASESAASGSASTATTQAGTATTQAAAALASANSATAAANFISQSFYKKDHTTVAFIKTAASTISVKAGTAVMIAGTLVTWAADTAVTMPALTAGTDYAIYACTDGTIRADSNWSAPSGYNTTNSRKIGGFHYSLTTAGMSATIANGFCATAAATRNGTTNTGNALITGLASTADLMGGMVITGTGITAGSIIVTVDSGTQVTMNQNGGASATNSLTFTNAGMVWTQADVDLIAGINSFSLWDLKFRPTCDPRGMARDGATWFDIYLCSTDADANGTSKYNSNIASETVRPKVPVKFGGNGTVTYGSLNWWVANELARSQNKRLPWGSEFYTAAFGVAENISLDGTSTTYANTARIAGKTSRIGLEQAAGIHWIWGQDSNFYGEVASPAGSWKNVNGNTGANGSQRGQEYTFGIYGLTRVILGGARAYGVSSGSRASTWHLSPWSSSWGIGLRAACDHLAHA